MQLLNYAYENHNANKMTKITCDIIRSEKSGYKTMIFFNKHRIKKTLVENIPNINSYVKQFNYGFFSTLQM